MQTEMVGPSHRFCCYAKVARKLSSFSVCITDLSHTLCDLYKCHICTYDSKIFSVYHRMFICRCSVFFPNVHEVSTDCDKVYCIQGSYRFGISCPKISQQNQLDIYFVTPRQYCSCIAKLKNVFRSTVHPTTKLIWNLLNFLLNRIFCWLTNWLTN